MRGLRLERPPGWAILVLVLMVAANVALFSLLTLRPSVADDYRSADRTSAATSQSSLPASIPTPELASEVSDEPPVLAVYGDGYASGNELGGVGAAGWPALIAEQTGARLVLNAVPQAGYASIGATGQDYAALVQSTPVPDAAVTLLFGSRNDADEDLALVRENTARVIATARQNAPRATLVVVGPAWGDAVPPASVLAVRDLVRTAAGAAGATFVDPLADGWFAGQVGLIAADGVSPTDAGHAHIAERLSGVVATALAAAAARPGA